MSAGPGGTAWAGTRPWLWALGFGIALAAIAWGERVGLLGGWRSLPFMAAAMLLLWPMARSAENRARACGQGSPAMMRYNRRSMIWSMAYVVALGVAITARNRLAPEGPLLWLLAVLPSVPIVYFVWAMARYLVEEKDEYLRHRAVNAALIGLGLVLVLGTFWGFLETFGLAIHVPGWWVVPIWAIGLGLGQGWMTLRERRGGGE
ncbi:MAG TPA: hypothetical protein VFF89_05860 [Sphingobium sp.]|nr:hypothetical protein [Sphingobium sp.]